MIRVRGRVRNGRLVVDEPTDLPEGTEVALVSGDASEGAVDVVALLRGAPPAEERLSEDDIGELRKAETGPFVSHEEVRKKLAARKA